MGDTKKLRVALHFHLKMGGGAERRKGRGKGSKEVGRRVDKGGMWRGE